MLYLMTFLEGILTFVSPCLLPLLPVFVSYFAGVSINEATSTGRQRLKILVSALAFMAGFTLIFVLMGVFAGSVGAAITSHQTIVNIVAGSIVVLFGLGYMGLFALPQINLFGSENQVYTGRKDGLRSFFFGIVFSVGWTPCISVFLGAAFAKAAVSGTWYTGALLLLSYSLGLGLPLVISAVLIDSLKGAFDFIKRNFQTIQRASGVILIVMGLLIASGLMTRLIGWLT